MKRVTPFTGYEFDLSKPLSGQAMRAYQERVVEPLQEMNLPYRNQMHAEYKRLLTVLAKKRKSTLMPRLPRMKMPRW